MKSKACRTTRSAKIMHCAKGTVMSRLHYARKKLQAALKDVL